MLCKHVNINVLLVDTKLYPVDITTLPPVPTSTPHSTAALEGTWIKDGLGNRTLLLKDNNEEIKVATEEDKEDEGFYSPQPPEEKEDDEYRRQLKIRVDTNMAAKKRKIFLAEYFTDSEEDSESECNLQVHKEELEQLKKEISVRGKKRR